MEIRTLNSGISSGIMVHVLDLFTLRYKLDAMSSTAVVVSCVLR